MRASLALILALLPALSSPGPAVRAQPRPPTLAAVIEGRTFRAGGDVEALAVVGRDSVVVRRCTFIGGSCQLRFVDCRFVLVEDCTFWGAAGRPDPDGQCVQLIRSTGTVKGNVFHASRRSEDLVSVYADRPVDGDVLVAGNVLYGRGDSDSSSSICLDGRFCPRSTVTGNRVVGARCAVVVAGGRGHVVAGNVFRKCEAGVYVHDFYGTPHFGGFLIR